MMMLDAYCSMVTKAWRKGNSSGLILELILKYDNKEIDTATFQKAFDLLNTRHYDSANDVLSYMPEPVMALGAQQDEMNINSWSKKKIKTLTDSLDSSNSPKDAEEVITNDRGGKQHAIPVAYDCLDTFAMQNLGNVLDYGKKEYGADNWRNIDTLDHINHAIAHLIDSIKLCKELQDDTKKYAYDSKEKLIEELSHAFARSMFALGTL